MFALAFRNLFSNRARNAFTAFSVMIAMMLVTFVVAAQLKAGEMFSVIKGRNNMIVVSQGGSMPIASGTKTIQEINGVKRVIYMIVTDASTTDKRFNVMMHATTADYTTISDSWFYVDPDGLKRWEGERTGALVGRQTAKEMNLEVGSRFTLNTALGEIPVVVSAISPKGYKATGVLVHHDYFGELFNRKGRANVFWVELNPGSDVKSIAKEVDAQFKNTDFPTQSLSSAAFLKTSADAGKVIPSLLTGAGLIILLATLLVTANTIAISIRERIPELATLRAIGFRRAKILRLLITEVLIVCIGGGAIGAVLPLLFFKDGVSMGMAKMTIGKVELPPEIALYVIALCAALGVVASIFPAWRASRADIASSLRAQA